MNDSVALKLIKTIENVADNIHDLNTSVDRMNANIEKYIAHTTDCRELTCSCGGM